ncbi:hypothetical protein JL720_14308 [Aureococcus anophagefferens]|nr:hypothetical protein JL720_14308 [Aureococcus anophagefferens]
MGRRRAVAVASAAAVAAAYAVPALDVGRRSPLGWTDAHNVAWLPVTPEAGVVADVDALAFLGGANDDYLCARNDYGQTALHPPCDRTASIWWICTRRRLCLDAANLDGDTPLHYAAVFQRTDAVWMLLGAGADPGATNADGATPLDDAREPLTVAAVLEAARSHPRTRPRGAGEDSTGLHCRRSSRAAPMDPEARRAALKIYGGAAAGLGANVVGIPLDRFRVEVAQDVAVAEPKGFSASLNLLVPRDVKDESPFAASAAAGFAFAPVLNAFRILQLGKINMFSHQRIGCSPRASRRRRRRGAAAVAARVAGPAVAVVETSVSLATETATLLNAQAAGEGSLHEAMALAMRPAHSRVLGRARAKRPRELDDFFMFAADFASHA